VRRFLRSYRCGGASAHALVQRRFRPGRASLRRKAQSVCTWEELEQAPRGDDRQDRSRPCGAPTGAWPSPTGCDEGRESHPLRALLIAVNRMVKPNIEGCGDGACLGAEMDSSAPSSGFSRHRKYCHNGGTAFAPQRCGYRDRRRSASREGSMNSVMAPIAVPAKRLICRQELQRVHDPHPLVAAIRSSGFWL
jgi:hypothetical protein